MQAEQRMESILRQIANESSAQRIERWQGLFDRTAKPLAEKLVLFGAGQFGQLVLGMLRSAGVVPCCFSDNNPSRWETHIDGVEVLDPAAAALRFGQTATFVVTVFNGSAARKQLRKLGCQRVLPATLLSGSFLNNLCRALGLASPKELWKKLTRSAAAWH